MDTGVSERGRIRRRPWIAPPLVVVAAPLAAIGAVVAVVGGLLMLGVGRG